MAWPFDRLRTYAPLAQVRSADLNAIQDAIVDRARKDPKEYTIAAVGTSLKTVGPDIAYVDGTTHGAVFLELEAFTLTGWVRWFAHHATGSTSPTIEEQQIGASSTDAANIEFQLLTVSTGVCSVLVRWGGTGTRDLVVRVREVARIGWD